MKINIAPLGSAMSDSRGAVFIERRKSLDLLFLSSSFFKILLQGIKVGMLGDVVFCLVVVALHERDCTVLGKVECIKSEEFFDEGNSFARVLSKDDGIEFFASVAAHLE